jgi:hypothetical protein
MRCNERMPCAVALSRRRVPETSRLIIRERRRKTLMTEANDEFVLVAAGNRLPLDLTDDFLRVMFGFLD